MLKLRNIQAGYGNILALKDISLEVAEGEIVTLIGANGAGKSTSLMTISGVVPCRSGKICVKGQEIQGLEPDRIVKMGVCQVPEGRHIFPDLTVRENLDMGAFLRRDRKEVRKDREYVYSLFPFLAERSNQDGGTLSGGEQQMLALSRALMARPELSCCWTSRPWGLPLLLSNRYSGSSRRLMRSITPRYFSLSRMQIRPWALPIGFMSWKTGRLRSPAQRRVF